MEDPANPKAFRDLDEHGSIIDVDHLSSRHLGDVQRNAKDVRVGLAEVDETGRNEEVDELIQLEG